MTLDLLFLAAQVAWSIAILCACVAQVRAHRESLIARRETLQARREALAARQAALVDRADTLLATRRLSPPAPSRPKDLS